MSDTFAQGRKSKDAAVLRRLSATLRSTSRKYPNSRLCLTQDGFGVSLADGGFLHIRWSGHLSDADIRDLLVLFARWLTVDPDRLMSGGLPLNGALPGVVEPSS